MQIAWWGLNFHRDNISWQWQEEQASHWKAYKSCKSSKQWTTTLIKCLISITWDMCNTWTKPYTETMQHRWYPGGKHEPVSLAQTGQPSYCWWNACSTTSFLPSPSPKSNRQWLLLHKPHANDNQQDCTKNSILWTNGLFVLPPT